MYFAYNLRQLIVFSIPRFSPMCLNRQESHLTYVPDFIYFVMSIH